MSNDLSNTLPNAVPVADLSALLISLLRGVLYRDSDERLWGSLLNLQARIRDYISALHLELVLDEAEGYAFLKSRTEPKGEEQATALPRLVVRRQLSFPVSLLLALLRKKLAESDARGGDTRLVMTRDEMVEMVRLFMPQATNEAMFVDQFEAHINKVIDLGFLRRLKPAEGDGAPGGANYEVRRILRSFVDAQWLSDLDAHLVGYRAQVSGIPGVEEGKEHE